jgi:nucleotide-binding universal stress UspA family protein
VAPGERWPTAVTVGVDGSEHAQRAEEIAREIAHNAGAQVSVLANETSPVQALVAASSDSDLVVVGSRGRTGIAAIGSVAERVAHQARSPVLIVR